MKKTFFIILSLCSLHVSQAVAQTVQPFALTDVRLLPSRFQRNMQRDSVWIASIPVRSLLHSFRNTAGVFSDKEGGYMTMRHLAGWESMDCDLRGHITGHLLSAMAYLQMREKADSLVQGLAEVQRQYGTGYLSAFGEGLIDRNIQGKSVWAPFYTLHKILQGLIDQYQLCGNETALTVARGMGDWAYNKLKPLSEETRQKMIRNEFGGFNDAMYQLYAITGNDHYLWVARFFYHDEKIDPLKQGSNDLGTNHANTFIPKLLGECRNYELFGDEDSRRAATLLFNTLTGDHAFVTGEVSDKEHLFKPEAQSKHLTGYDGENCCTYNLLKLADRLFCYEPDSRIADYYERALYNHILGQQDTLTSMVCYFTPLMTGGYRLYSTRDSSFWCCVGSGFESHAKYQSSIYFHENQLTHPRPLPVREGSGHQRTLYVNLFIPSEVNWDGTIVRQETAFPEANKTTITIIPPKGGVRGGLLKVRYPYWATYMKVNGKRVKAGKDGYVAIKCSMLNGQRSMVNGQCSIEIDFGMSLREEATKDDPSRVALMYGPIVLAGRLSEVEHPFSDPTKYNDYYTFDYGRHPDVPLGEVKHLGGLKFSILNSPLDLRSLATEGTQESSIPVAPFYDMQHCRYVVYWKK
ncbi:MAG: glycoside hydrolase family 127 protein [Prevotella sp.]|nr:glycoside hydrolase family 127 protein [Prevotella sp.]